MAITSNIKKVVITMKLENGNTSTGAIKTVGVALGSLNKDTYDAQKVMNIIGLLAPMFAKSLYTTQKTETSELEEE